MDSQKINHAYYAFISATIITSLVISLFFLVEPRVTRSAVVDTSGPFTITQTITGETAFLVDAANVTMVPVGGSVDGLTGGEAFGTTTFSVRSNNNAGYFVDIDFADPDLTGVAMSGVNTGSDAIANYNLGVSADYNFSTAQPNAVFAFTVDSLNPGDTHSTFLSTGSTCGSGTDEAGRCWIGPSTTAPIRIVSRDETTSSATTSIIFRVYVPSGADPVVPVDTYVATATLSLLEQI